jgi:hypothetical protein
MSVAWGCEPTRSINLYQHRRKGSGCSCRLAEPVGDRPLVRCSGGAPGRNGLGQEDEPSLRRLPKPQKMVVISAESGHVLDALPIGDGVDATAVDAGSAFASCRDGSFTVVAENTGKYKVAQVVKTPLGARTMGVDPATNTIYLPIAEFESQPPSSTSRPSRSQTPS